MAGGYPDRRDGGGDRGPQGHPEEVRVDDDDPHGEEPADQPADPRPGREFGDGRSPPGHPRGDPEPGLLRQDHHASGAGAAECRAAEARGARAADDETDRDHDDAARGGHLPGHLQRRGPEGSPGRHEPAGRDLHRGQPFEQGRRGGVGRGVSPEPARGLSQETRGGGGRAAPVRGEECRPAPLEPRGAALPGRAAAGDADRGAEQPAPGEDPAGPAPPAGAAGGQPAAGGDGGSRHADGGKPAAGAAPGEGGPAAAAARRLFRDLPRRRGVEGGDRRVAAGAGEAPHRPGRPGGLVAAAVGPGRVEPGAAAAARGAGGGPGRAGAAAEPGTRPVREEGPGHPRGGAGAGAAEAGLRRQQRHLQQFPAPSRGGQGLEGARGLEEGGGLQDPPGGGAAAHPVPAEAAADGPDGRRGRVGSERASRFSARPVRHVVPDRRGGAEAPRAQGARRHPAASHEKAGLAAGPQVRRPLGRGAHSTPAASRPFSSGIR